MKKPTHFALPMEVFEKLCMYLGQRPYAEVVVLIANLNTTGQALDITKINGEQSSTKSYFDESNALDKKES